MNSRTLVLSTGPHNFAGAGAAHVQTIVGLARVGTVVEFWPLAMPFRACALAEVNVRLRTAQLTSDAYGTSDAVKCAAQMEGMQRAAMAWLAAAPENDVVLLGTYLVPYGSIVETVARALSKTAHRVRCVLVAAGSDIWQLGPQLPLVLRELIDSPLVTTLVTYSHRFVEEIRHHTGTSREIAVIAPGIDVNRFSPLRPNERREHRRALGLGEDDFVLVHCSNHRPVKALQHVIEIAQAVGTLMAQDLHLVLFGPITAHLQDVLVTHGFPAPGEHLPYEARVGRLRVICAGVRSDMQAWHGIGDVAVNTSLHDSFNISLAEAMACGVPVVTTDVVGIGEIVRHYECGLLVPFDYNPVYESGVTMLAATSRLSPTMVAGWVGRLWASEPLRAELGRRARIATCQTCSQEIALQRWCGLLGLEPRGLQADSPRDHVRGPCW